MQHRLIALIASVMEVDPAEIGEDSGTETIEKWDSLREMMLASSLESEFGFSLTNDDMASLHSVKHILAILSRHGCEVP